MIYFIQNTRTGLIKVGYSRDPDLRLANLRTASADPLKMLATIPGDRTREKQLHRRFRRYWHRGEWFAISARLVDEIVECEEAVEAGERQHLLPFERPAPKPESQPLTFTIVVAA